mgnify:CR=1 FL=1
MIFKKRLKALVFLYVCVFLVSCGQKKKEYSRLNPLDPSSINYTGPEWSKDSNGNGVADFYDNAPGNLTAAVETVAGKVNIVVKWADNSPDETGFELQRKVETTPPVASVHFSNSRAVSKAAAFDTLPLIGRDITKYADASIVSGNTYTYRVRAMNGASGSAYSNETPVAYKAATGGGGGGTTVFIAAPSNLAATAASSTRINLAWTDNSSNEDGFRVHRKKTLGGTYAELPVAVPRNVSTFADTTVEPGFKYFYKVVAFINAGASSADSNEAAAVTPGATAAGPKFSTDVQPIFTANCASCHDGRVLTKGLDLRSGNAYGQLVNVVAYEAPLKKRVAPNDAANSYIIIKLEGRQVIGSQMPEGLPPLSSADIQTIRAWINSGAPNN